MNAPCVTLVSGLLNMLTDIIFTKPYEVGAVIITPILQMRKLRHRDRKLPIHGHTASKEEEQGIIS